MKSRIFGILFVLIFCLPVAAQDSCQNPDELEKLNQFLIHKKKAPKCPDLSEISDTFMVMFEGAGGYDPQNNGSSIAEPYIGKKYVPLAKKDKRNFVSYYSQHHAKEAADCVIKLQAQAKKLNKSFKVKAVGFSMGGGAAIRFSQRLEEHQIVVESLFTIDPVARSYHSIPSLVGHGNSKNFFRRPATLKKWVNYYQNTDMKSIVFGIKGYPGINADETHLQEVKEPKSGHLHIAYDKVVMKSFKKWLNE